MATATSLSAYLIPIYSNKKGKLNSVFSELISIYDSKDTRNFSEDESKKLEKLRKSFEKLFKALQNSKELRELIEKKMEELFKFTSETEVVLSNLYKKHLEIIKKLSKLFEIREKHISNKLDKQSKLETAKYRRQLLKSLKEGIEKLKEPFNTFIEEINKNDKEHLESNQAQGGAVLLVL